MENIAVEKIHILVRRFTLDFHIFLSDEFHSQTKVKHIIWASALDFQQCGMCDQQCLRSDCAYAQSDQSLC